MNEVPDLGTLATVVMDRETHGPRTLDRHREGLREVSLFDGPEHDLIDGDGMVTGSLQAPLVEEIDIVSHWSLHVALYALQQIVEAGVQETATPRLYAAKALRLLGTSGDCEGHVDHETLLPLPVPEPSGWGAA